MKKARLRLASLLIAAALAAAAVSACNEKKIAPPTVDGELALKYAQENYDLGPKIFRTEGAKKSAEWIAEQAKNIPGFEKTGGNVRIPPSAHGEYNVEITFPGKKPDFVIIGAHHDTKRLFSVPDFAGANDGASGVGALLAMARVCIEHMQTSSLPCGIRFVFFDGEEALYQYTETDGLVGSRAYVAGLRQSGDMARCRAMILLDMIGDKDLNIELAGNSTPALADVVMAEAAAAGYAGKFSRGKVNMLDDHYPFLQANLPAVDLIDFDYGPKNSYWHTGADTMDKISAESIRTAADVALRTVWRLAETGFADL
ncbi:MAG: Zn-dependent exopeptidase M28 [Lentisphaeria bacterium]|nr:Zn-dependent exopeptidase M28 [Lentisphaeria bacterium]